MARDPIFLVGAERSGTTLLRLMLDSHPEIAFGEEFEFSVELIGEDGSFPDMAEYGRYLETNRVFGSSGFTFNGSLSYPELLDGFLRGRQEAKGAAHVGATVHFGFSKALQVWPGARFIHIIRDPRDVSPSCMAMGWAGNVWHGLDKWVEAEDEWASLSAELDPERQITVRFGDLIDDHRATLTAICEFVGVSYTDEMLSYTAETDYAAPRPGVASSWRGKLADKDVQLIEARVGSRMAELGFEPSGLAPISVGEKRQRWLLLHDRVGKVRERARYFGVRLTAEEMLARAVGNEGWKRSVRLRLNEIELSYLKKSWSDSASSRSSV